ncbi:hypothetical protein KDAU_72190 [Dictyobacter aurantiacus]|uniref:Uncharacterized protein n=2 Tax=Dictyobacter aurantiacus TaxID=1936993 RepID=A0A401ZSY0_9CHLR|nr:hypothetical protein KDAU_72190 [Dictyobacter aurantiacus]
MLCTSSSSSVPSAQDFVQFTLIPPPNVVQIAASTLRAQLNDSTILLRSEPENAAEPLVLPISDTHSLSLSNHGWESMALSLQQAQGQVEISTTAQEQMLLVNYDRLSVSGELYPTRMMLRGDVVLLQTPHSTGHQESN